MKRLSAIFIALTLFLATIDTAGAQPKTPGTTSGQNPDEYAKDSSTEINVKNADIAAIIRIFSRKTKRNFILVKPPAPRFAILYESSAINDLRNNINDAKIAAQDDWTAIQDALIGGD